METAYAKKLVQQIIEKPVRISKYNWGTLTLGFDLNAIHVLFREIYDDHLLEAIMFQIVHAWTFSIEDYVWDKTVTPWKKKYADGDELRSKMENIAKLVKLERELGEDMEQDGAVPFSHTTSQDKTVPLQKPPSTSAPQDKIVPEGKENKNKGPKKGERGIVVKPKQYKTLQYFRHGESEKLVKMKRKRLELLYEKWKTPEVKKDSNDGGWEWLPIEIGPYKFEKFFEGEDMNCELKFKANKTILTIFLCELLKYKCKRGNGNECELLITEQKNQSVKKLVEEQFSATPNFDKKRLTDKDKARISESILILDYNISLPLKSGGGDNDFDTSDNILQQTIGNLNDWGVSPDADVKEAIKSGELRTGKHV